MNLISLAEDELSKLTVTISKPKVWRKGIPPAWNVGEWAYSVVHVDNSTGCSLRDVAIKTHAWGAAGKLYLPGYDSNGYVRELDPGAEYSFNLFMKAVSTGRAQIMVEVFADVIPYVMEEIAYREETVYPA